MQLFMDLMLMTWLIGLESHGHIGRLLQSLIVSDEP